MANTYFCGAQKQREKVSRLKEYVVSIIFCGIAVGLSLRICQCSKHTNVRV
jgi:hypothetical protein